MEKILDRLILGLEAKDFKKHGRATQLSKITGYSVGMISDILRGKVEISERFLDTICTKIGLSKVWIEKGEGEMLLGKKEAATQEKVVDEVLEFVLSLEPTPALRILLEEMKGKSKEEVMDYIRDKRKKLRGEKP